MLLSFDQLKGNEKLQPFKQIIRTNDFFFKFKIKLNTSIFYWVIVLILNYC
jgi:hypothetical protein